MKCIIIPKGTFDPSKTSIVRIPPLSQINGPLVVIPAKKNEITKNGSAHESQPSQQISALLITEAEKRNSKPGNKSANLHKFQYTIKLNESRKYLNDTNLVGTNGIIHKNRTTSSGDENYKKTSNTQMNSKSIQTHVYQESQKQNLVNCIPTRNIQNKGNHINRSQKGLATFQFAETNTYIKDNIKISQLNGLSCTGKSLQKQRLWNEQEKHSNSSSISVANACVQKYFNSIKEDCANNTDRPFTEDVACGDSCFKMTTDVCCGSNCCVSIVARNKNKRPKSSVHFDDYVHFVASGTSELKAYSHWDITDTKDPLKRAKMLQNYLKIKKRLQLCQS